MAAPCAPPYAGLDAWTRQMPPELRNLKQSEAEKLFRRIGITFAVYGEGGDPDRLITVRHVSKGVLGGGVAQAGGRGSSSARGPSTPS